MKASELKTILEWAFNQGQAFQEQTQRLNDQRDRIRQAREDGILTERQRIETLQAGMKLVPIDEA